MHRSIIFILTILLMGLMASTALAQKGPGGANAPLMNHNYLDANGANAYGGIHRHGGDFAGEGGKHGPFGPGPDDEQLPDPMPKLVYEDPIDDARGRLWRYCTAPAAPALLAAIYREDRSF